MMESIIEITPAEPDKTQVTAGDKVAVHWLLNAHVDPDDLTFTIYGGGDEQTHSGSDLQETEETRNTDERWWRYTAEQELPAAMTQIEFRLDDPVNGATDTAFIEATDRYTP